jgi:uncharacterized membrane protein
MPPGRLHALIDGVFAIAITLLVLDLPRPEDSSHLAHDLAHQWPSYVAYVVTFTTIGILWIEHHGMMSAVERINRRFLERTLLFLLFISIMPWPTALAAQYADKGDQAIPAAVLYATTMLLLGLSFGASWSYLHHHPELVYAPAKGEMAGGVRRAVIGALVYLVAIAVAFVSPLTSFAIDGIIAAYYAASRTNVPGLIYSAALSHGDDD